MENRAKKLGYFISNVIAITLTLCGCSLAFAVTYKVILWIIG